MVYGPKEVSSLFLLQCSVCLVANGRYTPNTYQLLLSYISEQFNIQFNSLNKLYLLMENIQVIYDYFFN